MLNKILTIMVTSTVSLGSHESIDVTYIYLHLQPKLQYLPLAHPFGVIDIVAGTNDTANHRNAHVHVHPANQN